MGIYLADQTMVFLQSLVVGALLGLLYDAFRISRIAIPTSKTVVFIEDIVYFCLCAVVTFVLMLTALEGQVRFFLLLGELIGAILYFGTLGVLVMKVSKTIIKVIKAIIRFFIRYLFKPIWRLVYRIISFILRPIYFLSEILKKSLHKLKYRLKVRRIVLYNACKDHFRIRGGRKKSNPEPEQQK